MAKGDVEDGVAFMADKLVLKFVVTRNENPKSLTSWLYNPGLLKFCHDRWWQRRGDLGGIGKIGFGRLESYNIRVNRRNGHCGFEVGGFGAHREGRMRSRRERNARDDDGLRANPMLPATIEDYVVSTR